MTQLTVGQPGPQTLIQDRGRPGLAHLGVGAAGAMDREAHALGNRLVGNPASAAGLEILLGGAEFTVDTSVWIAVTGAWGSVAANGIPVPPHTAVLLRAGEALVFGPAEHGIRYYLAVRGGIDVAPVLGSRSRDTLAQLGPPPLAQGDVVPVGTEPHTPVPAVDVVPVDAPSGDTAALEVRPGPRRDWFTEDVWAEFLDGGWQVSQRADRSGIRLDGPMLQRSSAGELPSEGMVPGAIQVSPDGAPTILAVDHPVTGGYPVIAVLTDESLDALAQLRPGQGIRFRLATGR